MADFDAARRSFGAFAEMLGRPLAGFQLPALTLDAFMTVLLAPRGAGKSTALALLAAHRAYTRGDHRVLVVSASEEAAKRLLAQVRSFVAGFPPLAESLVEETTQLLRLSSGSEIRCVSASERAIRGWRAGTLIVDEAARVSDELLEGAALPTTSATPGARVLLADVAGPTEGVFYDSAVRGLAGAEHLRTFRWELSQCTWITPTYIAQMRESMSEVRWRAEMECEFVGQADALFTRQALDRATVDYRPLELEELEGPARLLLGMDWGVTVDRSAAVAIARLPQFGERRFGVVCAKRWPQGAPLHDVIGDIVRSPACWRRVSSERNGVGEGFTQELFRRLEERPKELGGGSTGDGMVVLTGQEWVDLCDGRLEFRDGRLRTRESRARQERRTGWPRPEPFSTSKVGVVTNAALKASAYSALRLLVDREQLLIPADAGDLLRELLMLRVDLTRGGTEKVEASQGHDDLADGLMLSAQPYRARDGRWRTWLADLADPRASVPEPVVRVEALTREPRSVVLQSIAGHEVTPPAGLRAVEQLQEAA